MSKRHPGPLRRLSHATIDHIFETSDSQASYLIALHAAVIQDLDQVEKIDGHVQCSHSLWLYICGKCIEFDKAHQLNCMAGGAWLHMGFSANDSLHGEQIAVPPLRYLPGRQCVPAAQAAQA